MTAPYREIPASRLWEVGDLIVDLDRISMCCWDFVEDHDAVKALFVYLMGDMEPLELGMDDGLSLQEAWKRYRRA